MKLKIVSDGTVAGTSIVDESGETVGGVTAIRFRLRASELMTKAVVEFSAMPIEFTGEARTRGRECA